MHITTKGFLLKYLLCITIPIVAQIFLYIQSKDVMLDNAYSANASILKQNVQVIENNMADLKRIYDYLSLEQTITRFLHAQNPLNDGRSTADVINAQKILATLKMTTNFIDSIYIYSIHDDVLINNETSYIRTTGFYGERFTYGDMPEQRWRDEILNARHNDRVYPAVDIYDRQERQILMYAQSYPVSKNSMIQGNIFMFIDTQVMLDTFPSAGLDEYSALFIVDQSGSCLLSAAPNEAYTQSVLALNHAPTGDAIARIGQRDILITTLFSKQLNWTFMMCTPVDNILGEFNRIRNMMLMFIALTVFVGLAVSLVMAYRSAKPIDKLAALVSDNIPIDDVRYDFTLLQEKVKGLIDANQSLANEMRQVLPAQRIELFYRLLNGDFEGKKEIITAFSRIGIQLSYSRYAVLILVFNDMKPDASSDDMMRLKLLLNDVVYNVMDNVLVVYNIDLETQALVIASRLDSSAAFTTQVENAATTIYNRMLGNIGVSVSFSGNMTADLEKIQYCYYTSKLALQYKEKVSGQLILWYNHEKGTADQERANSVQKAGIQIGDIWSYIHAHYADCDISLASVSEQFGITEVYLSRMFKEQTGANFSKAIEQLRMERARYLMDNTSLPLYEISAQVGYASPQVFRRVHRRFYGENPSDHIRDHS